MKYSLKLVNLKLVLALAFFVIASGFLAEAVTQPFFDFLADPFGHYVFSWRLLFRFIVVLMLFIVSILFLHRIKSWLLGIKTLNEQECRPHKCLIIPLSQPAKITFQNSSFIIDNTKRLLATGDLHKDITSLNGTRWPWQQTMRGLEPHKKSLKLVCLIGSMDKSQVNENGDEALQKGSFADIDMAENLIRHYFSKAPETIMSLPAASLEVSKEPTPLQATGNLKFKKIRPVDFDSFKDMVLAIKSAVQECKNEGYRESEILIDVTGGPKTASIAGAGVTFSSAVKFQYVNTLEYSSVKDVKEYDTIFFQSEIG